MTAFKTNPTDSLSYFRHFAWLFFFLLLPGQVGAQSKDNKTKEPPVRVEILADVAQVGLGEEYRLGVRLHMAPGWHIYWLYPGNTGKATRVQFSSDENHTKVLEPQFPAPEVFDAKHIDDLSFGYSGSTLLWATAMTFDSPPEGKTRIQAEVQWLACKEACVTGKAKPSQTLPVGNAAKASPHAKLFEAASAANPKQAVADQVWLNSAKYVDGQWELHYGLSADMKATSFVPRWLQGGSCKILEYGIEKGDKGQTARIRLKGDNCLPGTGGIITRADMPPLGISAFAAEEKTPLTASAKDPAEKTKAETETPLVPMEQKSLWLMLLFAFLGGLLLNVMPCVIPVVIPKMLHVVRTAQKVKDPGERRRILWSNSLAYAAGVIVTLLSLGAVVVALKQVGREVGWGFQFQNPWFLVFMVALLLVLGLGMLHVFPLQSAGHTDDLKNLRKMRRRSPLLESFLTGLLVTFLGTPCTAPMLGPALGYAFTASSGAILLFLATVGLGLSTPFLLLGAWTGWTRILPKKVTDRYDRIMRGMAFLLFGTAVWLLGVLADGYGINAAMNLVWFLLALGFGAWIFGLWTSQEDAWRRRLLKLLPLALAVGLFGAWVLEFPEGGRQQAFGIQSHVGIKWQPFSEDRLRKLRTDGRTVFVDFTAQWCMNCKANERLVIETRQTQKLLEKLNIETLKADATRFDPVIQRWLKRHGRAGVPMYLIFPACGTNKQTIMLPEILTSSTLHDALKKAGPSRSSCNGTPGGH